MLLIAAGTIPGIAATNDAPLADAGLDQTVTRGTTVYLDGGESRSPDKNITGFSWTISTPSETTRTPKCADCEQTKFVADTVGTYEVTLRVTDDDNSSATDTLYVTVNPGEPPAVSLAGPGRLSTGEAGRFTSTIDGGRATLDSAVWYVDSERRKTTDIGGNAATTSHRTFFPDTGTYEVKVVATDADGQQDTARRTVTVTSDATTQTTETSPVTESPQTPTETTPTNNTTSTDGSTPDILGPRIITGADRFTGAYELSEGGSGSWRLNDRRVGTGESVTLNFEPGVHELYAAPDGDSDGIAEFPDGSRSVVADPVPELTVAPISNDSVPTVDAYATDDLGNLESITVFVDGKAHHSVTRSGLDYSENGGDKLAIVERLEALNPGMHSVTVRTTDARGQTDSFQTTVDVPGPPEVVSTGFVNDGPLDQYHPRIDSSRYTAVYEVVVDLNGVNPEDIRGRIEFSNPASESATNSTVPPSRDQLIVRKVAFRNKTHNIFGRSKTRGRYSGLFDISEDEIGVTSSPPEINIDVVAPQSTYESGRRGMALDAKRSFDPDGTDLDFDWYGVQGNHIEKPTATLDSWNAGKLEVTDKQKQSTTKYDLVGWFAPKLTAVEVEGGGLYYPDETVTVKVVSERYYLSKPTYDSIISFGLRTESGLGNVLSHTKVNETPEEVEDPDPPAKGAWNVWKVEIPAQAFVNGTPTVASYPTDHPKIGYTRDVPDVRVLVPTGSRLQNHSTNVKYRVERPTYKSRQTADEDLQQSLKNAGYEVVGVTDGALEYRMEERVKIEDAVEETRQLRFRQRGRRGAFLEMSPEWSSAGTTRETKTRTTTSTEWRPNRRGAGTFTGETRQKLVEEGVTRTEKKFRYETTVTYQETETYTEVSTTTETHVEYEQRCTTFGCYKFGRTVSETVHNTVTKTRTVTRTRTTGRTYWSTRAHGLTHEYTGQRRRVTIREPEYQRQYKFEVESEQTSVERIYLAERQVTVSPAKYEWQTRNTMHNRLHAETAAISDDVRIGEVATTSQWTLEKQTGATVESVDNVQSGMKVLKTIGEGKATLVERYRLKSGKLLAKQRQRESKVTRKYTESEYVPKDEVETIVKEMMEDEYET